MQRSIRINERKKPIRMLTLLTFILALFNNIWFFSMRHLWSGIYGIFGVRYLSIIIFFLLCTTTILAFIFLYRRLYRKIPSILFFSLSIAFFIALSYMFWVARSNYPFIVYEFLYLLIIIAAIALVAVLIIKFPVKISFLNAIKLPFIILLTVAALLLLYNFPFRSGIEYGPVVYAVGENYQIVFTTHHKSLGWVEINGYRYHNLYAGSAVNDTVHKIEVPMSALDNAREYTIGAQTMIFRGPYDGIKGEEYSQTVSFFPVDNTEQFHFYAISDTHDFERVGSDAASYWGDELDLLIMIGDISSFITKTKDATLPIRIAGNVTGGCIPVVYARGNHDVKGAYDVDLHNYVSSDGMNFYFTFRVGHVWGVVLDTGEDHEDDWWEFYGTAFFEQYRTQQTLFLQEIIENSNNEFNAPGVTTRLALSHIPISYYRESDFMKDAKSDWIDALNQMNLDLMLSGHTHRLFYIDPATMPADTEIWNILEDRFLGYASHLNAPSFIVSTTVDEQLPGNRMPGRGHVGIAGEITKDNITLRYTNSKGYIIDFINPFTDIPESMPISFKRGIRTVTLSQFP